MKTYRVYASQLVFYSKDIQAESEEQAEELAFEQSNSGWKDYNYGDWEIEECKEVRA